MKWGGDIEKELGVSTTQPELNGVCEHNCYCIPPKFSFFARISVSRNRGRVHKRRSTTSTSMLERSWLNQHQAQPIDYDMIPMQYHKKEVWGVTGVSAPRIDHLSAMANLNRFSR